VEGGKLSSWTIVEDSLERRASLGLTAP
jgi:hypothetical protein